MKKSIFLFFAAILCATNAWGKDVYAVNYNLPGNGSNTYCHNWQNTNTNTTSWPGTKMTKTSMKAGTNDIYKCTLKAATNNKVIFSANGSSQSSTYTLDSKYPQPTYANGSWWYSPRITSAIWGDKNNVSGGYMYFDNSHANWNDTYIYVVVGHDAYLGYYPLTKLDGTKLYYASLKDLGWGDAKFVVMAGHSSSKSKGNANANTITDLNHFSDAISYGLNTGTSYMITMESGTNCTPISIDWNNDGYTKYNHTQTIYKVIDNAATTKDAGTVTITTTKLTNNCVGEKNNSTATIAASSSSATADAVQTATVTLQATAKPGYEFLGWAETADGTVISTEATYTYTASSAKSYYAKFQQIYTVTVNNDGNGTTTPSGAQASITEKTGVSINATPNTDYEFVNWTIESGTGSFGSDAKTAENTFYPTSDATIQANFRSTITYSLTVSNGTNVESVTGSTDPVTLGNSYEITATPKTGYKFEKWTAEPAENATFDDAASASTNVTVQNGSVTVTASATEIMSTLTTVSGTPSIAAPTASASEIGIATTATITAATHADYALTSWTLENCVRTDAGADNATEITVKSNGDGAAATVTANYTEIPTETVYFVNNKEWASVAIYGWGGTAPTTEGIGKWAGVSMTKTAEQVKGFDVYSYTAKQGIVKNILFNYNGQDATKTFDFVWNNGKYYYMGADANYAGGTKDEVAAAIALLIDYDYYVTGTFNSWGNPDKKNGMILEGELNKATISLKSGDNMLKVTNGTWNDGSTWGYSNLGANYEEVSNPNDNNNIKITLDADKEVTVIFNSSTKKITFTGLTEKDPTIQLAGSMNGCETWADCAVTLTLSEDKKTATANIELAAETTYEFKILRNADEWLGVDKDTEIADNTATAFAKDKNNCKITTTIAGEYTFTWNVITSQLTVTYPTPEPVAEVIRGDLTSGQWGTLCPTQDVENPTGATFYQIDYLELKEGLPFNMHFYEVEGNLEAGQPYFFIASATEIKGVKSGEEKNEGSNVNGFYGYIGAEAWTLPYQASFDVNNNNTFVIWNNSVFRINAETSIKSERCYIIININNNQPSHTSTLAPVGARRITMGISGINGQNTATGMENVDASAQPVKTIINGQLFILRGEKMYDAQGKLVK